MRAIGIRIGGECGVGFEQESRLYKGPLVVGGSSWHVSSGSDVLGHANGEGSHLRDMKYTKEERWRRELWVYKLQRGAYCVDSRASRDFQGISASSLPRRRPVVFTGARLHGGEAAYNDFEMEDADLLRTAPFPMLRVAAF
jgi:hypothetical protein